MAGFVRRADGQSNAPPPPGLQALVSARRLGAPDPLYRQTVVLSGTGAISAGFTLPADALPGEYVLGATIAGTVFHTNFAVRVEEPPPLRVDTGAPALVYAGDAAPVDLVVRTPDGQVVAGAAISWTVDVERLPFPARPGYLFGDAELAPALPAPRAGAGQSDGQGRFGFVITDTLAVGTPLRYRLVAHVSEAGGSSVAAETSFVVLPALAYVGVRLPERVLVARQRGSIDTLVVAPDGGPIARARVTATVLRRAWETVETSEPGASARRVLRPNDQRVATLAGTTGADGTLSLPVSLRAAGEYRVRVSVEDADGRQMISAATLWVAAPGFTAWRAQPAADARLIADRAAYSPGDTASLLLAAPHTGGTALLTVARDSGLSTQVRQLRAGVPLTLTLAPEDAPEVRVALLLASPAPGLLSATAPITLATTTLLVSTADRVISTTIQADRAAYMPGATATFTITTADSRGAPIPADVILDIAGARAAPRLDGASGSGRSLAETFDGAPPPLATARVPGAPPQPVPVFASALPPVASASMPRPGPLAYWGPVLRTSPGGVLTTKLKLPGERADLRARVWAAGGADRFGQASAAVVITEPLELEVDAPDFFRSADEVELAAMVRNTSAVTQEASVSLSADGLDTRAVPLTQRVVIAAGAGARVAWPALVGGAARAVLRFDVQTPGGAAMSRRIERPIVRAGSPTPFAGDVGILREYLDPPTNQPLDLGGVRAGRLVRVRLTIVNHDARRAVVLDEPLPGGSEVADAGAAGFATVGHDTGRLLLTAAQLPPGIYQYTYVIRIGATGRYQVPAPTLRLAEGDVIGAGTTTMLTIDKVTR
jgi:uncharacterized protein YfaS (alpha-2-macroglobulin family)